jgi:hypothetical protein
MDELRAMFIAGPGAGLSAPRAFTNRIGEVEAFRRSVLTTIAARSVGQ